MGPRQWRLRGQIDGRDLTIAGLDVASAPDLVEAAIERSIEVDRAGGCGLALLFAGGDAERFERLGFTRLPATEAACMSGMPAPWPREPEWVAAGDPFASVPGLRTARSGDLQSLVDLRDATTRGQRFRILRDAGAWASFLRSADPENAAREGGNSLWVIEGSGRVEAYVALTESSEALMWREHGARPGADDLLATLFWGALARARRLGVARLQGWFLPPVVTDRPLYPVARRTRTSPLVLLRSLDPTLGSLRLTREEDCRVWDLDRF